jgi:putative membrane protein
MALFDAGDEARISQAIVAAEKRTAGEIVAVVAAESDSYLHLPLLWAAAFAFLVPWVLITFTWWPVTSVFVAQLIAFGLAAAILMQRPVRYWLTPQSVKHARAHRRAVEQFLTQNLHTTTGRTGVLIFVSLAEHYAEVLADAGIHAKVPQGEWQSIVDRLTGHIGADRAADGFVGAIDEIGAHLAKHFPPGTHDPNELPNHLIVLGEG